MQKGEVSQTFAVNTTNTVKTSVTDSQTGEKTTETALSFMALLAPENDKNITEENTETISQDIAAVIKNQKQVLSEEQNTVLRGTLGAYFLNNEMGDAYNAKLAGTDATAKLRSKIKQVATAFGLTFTDSSLSSNISTLSQSLQSKFSIPPTYIANLNIINNWLVALEKISKDSPSREDFQKSLPNNLIFK
jgi:hypothetical protein